MKTVIYLPVAALVATVCAVGCGKAPVVQSTSGVEMANVGKLETDGSGHTVEQRNLIERIKKDNEISAVKHLYVISAYSGQVIMYSTVRGKVTSGGKRLTPKTIERNPSSSNEFLPQTAVGGRSYGVSELPNEDGTYGSASSDYLFWFDSGGKYHQHYLSGGQILHISDQPIAVKSVILNVEAVEKK